MSEKRKLKIGERQLISEKENIIEKGLSSKLKSEIGIKRPNNYEHGVTLIALVVTMVLHYDKVKKCSNSNSFLLSSI